MKRFFIFIFAALIFVLCFPLSFAQSIRNNAVQVTAPPSPPPTPFPLVSVEAYVLDGYGGVHTTDPVKYPAPAMPYFGWDIARAITLGGDFLLVLDGYGGIHCDKDLFLNKPNIYFGWDIAVDIALDANNIAVLDGFGGIHISDNNWFESPSEYFGWNIARSLNANGKKLLSVDGFGGVHYTGTDLNWSNMPYFLNDDVIVDSVLYKIRLYSLHRYGNVYSTIQDVPYSSTYLFGWDIAKAVDVKEHVICVLDGFGGLHWLGEAPRRKVVSTYFGWNIARDLELILTDIATGD